MNGRARTAIYALAGIYMISLAYYMFKGLHNSQGNEKILVTVFMVLFLLIGVAMVGLGAVKGYQYSKELSEIARKELEEEQKNHPKKTLKDKGNMASDLNISETEEVEESKE